MATEKQIAANRANAQHCTGPKTEEGKANSSKNSFKHGLDAKSEIIRYEKREDYDKLIAEYYARFNPATPEERALVDDLIKSEWHGRRFHAVDALVLDRAIENVPSGNLGIALYELRRHTESRRTPHQLRPAQLPACAQAAPRTPGQSPRTLRRPGGCPN